ncbi:cell division protein DivIVA [Klebsiella pneumoniae]|uniref:Cell division protein DivIVA n=1 Tax=Klebsiella pneumoniae TaxID=573 RepID=A0A447RGU6_KLEPN|nr:cell division protein DivIVA [Klebsiella pneumoniae]
MSVKTNAVLVCTLSLLLSACSGRASAPGSAEDAKISAEVDKILRDYQNGFRYFTPRPMPHAYLARIQAAIFANIGPAGLLARAKMLGALYAAGVTGTVQDPTVESGDRPFCAQVMSALKKANIPPAPDEKTYQTFSHVVLDVKP